MVAPLTESTGNPGTAGEPSGACRTRSTSAPPTTTPPLVAEKLTAASVAKKKLTSPWASLAGGVLLGVASAAFILLNGRILGGDALNNLTINQVAPFAHKIGHAALERRPVHPPQPEGHGQAVDRPREPGLGRSVPRGDVGVQHRAREGSGRQALERRIDLGAVAEDHCAGNITDRITIAGTQKVFVERGERVTASCS